MEKREPAHRSVAGQQTRSMARRDQQGKAGTSRQATQAANTSQLEPATANMSFEEAYAYYTHGVPNPYQAGSNTEYGGGQGFYYTPSMQSSYGPQVGPSSSARFDFKNLVI